MPAWLAILLAGGTVYAAPKAIKKLKQRKSKLAHSDKKIHSDSHRHKWINPFDDETYETGPAIPLKMDGETIGHTHHVYKKLGANGGETGLGVPEVFYDILDHFHVIECDDVDQDIKTGPSYYKNLMGGLY